MFHAMLIIINHFNRDPWGIFGFRILKNNAKDKPSFTSNYFIKIVIIRVFDLKLDVSSEAYIV